MKLSSISIQNFRGFESIKVPFDPSFTLCVGGNGAGKTALLEATAMALGSLFTDVPQWPVRSISASDARRITHEDNGLIELQPQSPVVIDARGELADERGSTTPWRGVRTLIGALPDTPKHEPESPASRITREVREGRPPNLPLIAFYGTQRLWTRDGKNEKRLGVGNRFDGYADCLDPKATAVTLARWMERQTLIELQTRKPHVQLAAVQAAVRACIDSVDRVWFDVAHDEIRLHRGDQVLSFSMLSDGYRNMVALVADLARRAAVLNPQHGERACELTDGVVVIDELELHLHPSWQRRVITDLRRTFPRVQFIATTHSPQVLASVHREQVRLLKDNRLIAAELFVEGRDSNALLEDVFGVPARPPEVQAEIDEIFRMLDRAEYEAARARLTQLLERLGPHDSDVVRAQWVLDVESPIASK